MKTQKRKLNVRLLRRIQKHILEEPRRFFMEDVVLKADTQEDWEEGAQYYSDASKLMPHCHTAACIGGWANLLSGAKRRDQYESYNRAVSAAIDFMKQEPQSENTVETQNALVPCSFRRGRT